MLKSTRVADPDAGPTTRGVANNYGVIRGAFTRRRRRPAAVRAPVIALSPTPSLSLTRSMAPLIALLIGPFPKDAPPPEPVAPPPAAQTWTEDVEPLLVAAAGVGAYGAQVVHLMAAKLGAPPSEGGAAVRKSSPPLVTNW